MLPKRSDVEPRNLTVVAIKQRAVSPEQKALRREQILSAAGEMFATLPYEAVKLTDLATAVGMTKPALYRYFRGKEVLFLALFEQELSKLTHQLVDLGPGEKLGEQIASVFARNPLYCRLTAILHTVLERDLTYEEALAFKRDMKRHVSSFGQKLAVALGTADTALVFDKMVQMKHAVIGAWHMSHPVGAVAEVLELEEFSIFRTDFETALAKHLTAILKV